MLHQTRCSILSLKPNDFFLQLQWLLSLPLNSSLSFFSGPINTPSGVYLNILFWRIVDSYLCLRTVLAKPYLQGYANEAKPIILTLIIWQFLQNHNMFLIFYWILDKMTIEFGTHYLILFSRKCLWILHQSHMALMNSMWMVF